jgi:hypothetical protein
MDGMQPALLPKAAGIDYLQVVYRVVVRYNGERGVYFLRSDADNPLICLAGEWLTYFRFHRAATSFSLKDGVARFDLSTRQGAGGIHAAFDLRNASEEMPASSKFSTLGQAKEFLVELYTAFGYKELTQQIKKVRIERSAWGIVLARDMGSTFDFVASEPLRDATRLDSVFYVKELSYHWHRLGRQADNPTVL